MHEVTVDKADLLARLRENRAAHHAAVQVAREHFRQRAIQVLDRRLESARSGGPVNLTFRLPRPRDHTKAYDRVITMVEMSVDETITLSAQDFGRYVMDDWEWKPTFAATAARLSAGLARTGRSS